MSLTLKPAVNSLAASWTLPQGTYADVVKWRAHPSGPWTEFVPASPTSCTITGLAAVPIDVQVVLLPVGGVLSGTATPLAPVVPPPPPAGITVNAVPTGPAAPAGGWKCVLADGFDPAHPLSSLWGANQDNDNGRGTGPVFRGNDKVEATHPSQVTLEADGLHLTAVYRPGSTPDGSYNYLSGAIVSFAANHADPEGGAQGFPITGFDFLPTPGVVTCFESVCAMPPINQPVGSPGDWGEDPGYWLTTSSWKDEIDLFEGWGYHPAGGTQYVMGVGVWISMTAGTTAVNDEAQLAPQSDQQFHRWTHVFDGTKRTLDVYLDGKPIGSMPWPANFSSDPMYLLFTHDMRNVYGRQPTWTKGSTAFKVRSVAVYQDTPNAGKGVRGGLIAPGTTLK